MHQQISPEVIDAILNLPTRERAEMVGLIDKLAAGEATESARQTFLGFVKYMWPAFIEGQHHKIMAEAFDRVISGDLKRVIFNMPPRHSKSEFASHYLPAYYLGHHPDRKIIQATHTADLSVKFGRNVRDMVGSEEFRKVFPKVKLRKGLEGAGEWNTSERGEYFAIGVGGKVAGRGADLFIIDDPVSEQEALSAAHDPAIFMKVWDWYLSGPRQRLQPGGAIVIVMTRWGQLDLTGLVVKQAKALGTLDEWEIVEFPAIFPDGSYLWPEFWSPKEYEAFKAELTRAMWLGQYQQHPTAEEGAIIKRQWWKKWPEGKQPPKCSFIIQSWDTAHTAKARSDYSACTTWGVFEAEDPETGEVANNIILLNAFRKQMEYPQLKDEAWQSYLDWTPDCLLIEAKAAGLPLTQELRRRGIPVMDVSPSRGRHAAPNDKVARANAVADIFRSGYVWYPDRKWAEEVVEECAEFPNGQHDDYLDCTTQALQRVRNGGMIRLNTDKSMNDEDKIIRKPRSYY